MTDKRFWWGAVDGFVVFMLVVVLDHEAVRLVYMLLFHFALFVTHTEKWQEDWPLVFRLIMDTLFWGIVFGVGVHLLFGGGKDHTLLRNNIIGAAMVVNAFVLAFPHLGPFTSQALGERRRQGRML